MFFSLNVLSRVLIGKWGWEGAAWLMPSDVDGLWGSMCSWNEWYFFRRCKLETASLAKVKILHTSHSCCAHLTSFKDSGIYSGRLSCRFGRFPHVHFRQSCQGQVWVFALHTELAHPSGGLIVLLQNNHFTQDTHRKRSDTIGRWQLKFELCSHPEPLPMRVNWENGSFWHRQSISMIIVGIHHSQRSQPALFS